MRALQIATFGDPAEVVQLVEIPDPDAPRPGEVLIAVDYVPINTSALLLISGRYGVRPALPIGVGNEGVGRILSVGEAVDHVKVGDRVLIPLTASSWRERLVVPAEDLFPLPSGADPQQLSMLHINPPTAALLLSEYGDLTPGEWVLQNAGNSGVGRSVIAFAKDRGLRVVSLIRRQELVDDLLAAGSDAVLVDGDGVDGIADRVANATGHAQIRVALDGVAGASMRSLSSCLAPGGTLVVYAFMSEQPGLINPADLIFRGVTIRGFWLEAPQIRASSKLQEALKTGARLIADGKLQVPIAATYALSEYQQALAHAQRGGKVLLHIAAREH